jgi:hypothetical protein
MYVLEYAGQPPRQMPIYVFKNWQTQVFIIFRKRPWLEGATILLAHPNIGFEPSNHESYVIDMALSGLQNNVALLPKKMLRELINAKFDNPMMGLLGAHLLLKRNDATWGQMDMVLGNLGYLLGEAPDVEALRIMAALRFEKSPPVNLSFSSPPMLRAAYEGLVAADNSYPNLIPDGGPLERIASEVYRDSPWTSWAPLPAKPIVDEIVPYLENLAVTAPYIKLFTSPWLTDVKRGDSAPDDWLKASMLELMLRSEKTGQPLDLKRIARDMDVPLRTVKQTVSQIQLNR